MENFFLQFVGLAHRFEGVIKALLRLEGVAKCHRHPLEADVVTLLLYPVCQCRLENMAVRAGVPEEFGNFDLLAGFGGLRFFERAVVDAVDRRRRGRLCASAGQTEAQTQTQSQR